MKMQNLHRLFLVTAFAVTLFACKKNNDNNTAGQSNADLQTQSDDQTRVSNETDAAFDDVNTAMTNQATVTGSSESPGIRYGVAVTGGSNHDTVQTTISNAVVTIDTIDNPHTIIITYNGKTFDQLRSRSGSIVVSWAAGARWHVAGTQVTVNFNNLKITRLLDNKSIMLNGTHTYTNVSGGSLASLGVNTAGPIVHTIASSNMSITFDNGAQRTWNVARQRTYTYAGGLVITTAGTHTDGNTKGISEWGTNRFGNSFTTSITQDLVIRQSCGWQLTSGSAQLVNAAGTTAITFGLDSTGAVMASCPLTGGFYYLKLSWTGNAGKTYTFIMPY